MPITDFDVTYGDALAPAGFHKVTRPDGHSADVNAHSGGVGQTYLWYHVGPTRGAPIVEVDVLYGEEEVPEGWEKVGRDLSKGSSRSTYLCFRRSGGEEDGPLPLAEVKVVDADEEPEGFTRLPTPLCRGDKPVYLCVKRATEAAIEAPPWSPRSLEVNGMVDLKDASGKWVVATVVAVADDTITVRAKGYRWDDQLPLESPRLAALGTHTGGAEGASRLVQGQYWGVTSADIKAWQERMAGPKDYPGLLSAHEEYDPLIRVELTSFVERTLSSAVDHEILFHCYGIVRNALPLFVRYIAELGPEPVPPHMLRVIQTMLTCSDDSSSYLFRKYGWEDCFENIVHSYVGWLQLRTTREHMPPAPYLLLTNGWGTSGGFEAMSWRIRTAPLPELHIYLGLIRQLVIAENQAVGNVISHAKQACRRAAERYHRITNEELSAVLRTPPHDVLDRLDNEVAMLTGRNLASATRAHTEKDEGDKLLDLYLQCAGLRLLRCPSLNLRIKGQQFLTELVSRAKGRYDPPVKQSYSYLVGPPPAKEELLTYKQAAQWVVEHRVLELVLGDPAELKEHKLEDTHYELVRRVAGLLDCVLQHGLLADVHVEALWGASLKQADTQVRVVYKFIAEMAPRLSSTHLALLSRHARELPQPFEDFHLELIVALTMAAAGAREGDEGEAGGWRPEEDEGFELLWGVALGQGPETKPEVVDKAMDAVVRLVQEAEGVERYAAACVAVIREHRPARHALNVLRSLVDCQIPHARSRAIERLDRREDGQLLHILVEELVRYRHEAEAAARASGLMGSDAACEATLLPGRQTHAEEVNLRLDLLKHLCACSSLHLELEGQIEDLLPLLVASPLCARERELFLDWLATLPPDRFNSVYSGSKPGVTRDTTIALFKGLLATPEAARQHGLVLADLGEHGYDCLAKYFRLVNEWGLRLEARTGPVSVKRFRELEGLDALREVCLKSRSDAVSQKAGALLIELHLRLRPQHGERRVAICAELVRRCMDRIGEELLAIEADPHGSHEGPTLVISRSLGLLRGFLDQLAQQASTHRPAAGFIAYGSQEADVTNVTVAVFRGIERFDRDRVMNLRLEQGTATYGQLRARVAREMGVPGERVRLQRDSHHDDEYVMSEDDGRYIERVVSMRLSAHLLQLSEADTKDFDPSTLPLETLDDDGSEQREAALQLLGSTPEYFDRLFALLELPDGKVVDDAWSIIKTVPDHQETVDRLEALGERRGGEGAVDWPAVLHAEAPLRLLYVLQMIQEARIRPFEAHGLRQDERDRGIAWLLAFVKAGGLSYLISSLATWRVEGQCDSQLGKQALSELIRFVACFLMDEREEEGEAANGQGGDGGEDEARPDSDSEMQVPSEVSLQKAARAVFARVDRRALADKLIEVLAEVTNSTRVEPKPPSLDASEDQGQAAAATHTANPSPRMVRGAAAGRDLMRRPSWSHKREWEAELYPDPFGAELSQEVTVARSALQLLLMLANDTGVLSEAFVASSHVRDVLRYGLLQSGDETLRRVVASNVHKLCAWAGADAHVDRAVLKIMVELLGETPLAGGPCEEFFTLLTRLLSAKGVAMDPVPIARTLARLLKQRPVVEASEEDADPALRGLMSSLRALLAFLPEHDPTTAQIKREVGAPEGEGLLDELVHRCLFAKPTTDAAVVVADGPLPPKCKHAESREIGLGLVLELTHGCAENLRHVLAAVEEHHTLGATAEERERRRQRSLRKRKNSAAAASSNLRRRQSGTPTNVFTTQQSLPYHASRSRTGYCGLKNLGCICYMNSMIQQFYMIRGFREGILGFEDPEDDKDESLMFQLQSLFAHLQESHKGYYNPKGFCHALKNWEGEPTDPFIQQDAQEFLTLFLQQVEGRIQGTRSEGVLKEYFGGTLSNELLAAEGKKYSEREEPFYFITVTVRNMRTLETALENFIAGERVDYTWESKDSEGEVKKDTLPTEKRVSFKSLPRHLIIHLKRFDFDFETMQQLKINDRLEFPMELDMRPYTGEGRRDAHVRPAEGKEEEEEEGGMLNGVEEERPPEYYRYRLAGVVVHMGTAHSGHYYSYIRERTGKRRWFEFNDTYVGDFNLNDMESECFGGQETSSYGRGVAQGGWMRERIRNAFMVVYDREDVATDTRRRGDSYRPPIPAPIREEILRENLDFWRKTNILTDRYFEFMTHLLEPSSAGTGAVEPEVYLREIMLATRFALGTLVEARSGELVVKWVARLKGHYERCSAACRWLLETLSTDVDTLRDLLVECDDAHARGGATALMLHALRVLEGAGEAEGVVLSLTRALVAVLPVSRAICAAYVSLLLHVVRASPAARALVLAPPEEGGDSNLKRLMLLFMGGPGDDVRIEVEEGLNGGWEKQAMQGADALALLMQELLLGCVIPGAENSSPLLRHPEHVMSEEEAEVIAYDGSGRSSYLSFHARLAMGVGTYRARKQLQGLYEHLLWENSKQSTLAVAAVCEGVKKEEGAALKAYFRALMAMVEVEDALQAERVHYAMRHVLAVMEGERKHVRATELGLTMLVRMARLYKVVWEWMGDKVEKVELHKPSWTTWSSKDTYHVRRELRWAHAFLQSRLSNGGAIQGDQYATKNRMMRGSSSPVDHGHSSRFDRTQTENLLAALNRAGEGLEIPAAYDSDTEPESIVGRKIRVRWTNNEFYKGTVVAFDPDTGRHHVNYEDGDQKEYLILEKTWDFEPTTEGGGGAGRA